MLTVHHLGLGQSERIVWLCEELGLDYHLERHTRDPVTRLAPPSLLAVHPLGAAPVLQDGDVLLAESAAIVEYIIARHGQGRLKPAPDAPDYADFLHWFHLANGTLQPAMLRLMMATRAQLPADHPVPASARSRVERLMAHVEARLGEVPYLAGQAFTAADIMSVFSLTTMRHFQPLDLGPYPAVRAWLRRIAERPAYARAMARSDPGFTPLLD